METDIILEVKNLSVTIGAEEILKGISFAVKRGSALAIIGPNGAGKTILFKALLGIIPHQGEIHWEANTRVGYVPQRFDMDRSVPLTVKEFFLLKSRRFWRGDQRFLGHLEHDLGVVGLSNSILQKSVSELSGGELQRLLISWAMVDHPDVLLLDEPTAGIDIGFEETIYQLMHRLQDERGTTILLISHDLNVVYRYAEEVLCINKQMICQGRPQEVLNPEDLAKIYGAGGFYRHPEKAAH